ncbi:hypothetical protein BCR42DRAFT_423514 [Absidia repens]|uniref:Uncharacterized protein n=1 Tax=Absidia repens TaxID=90262 RepID=A0A1X2I4V7_9FUNG|nr:hypothetical protein BCR42DRAFT_423514 [Absidia repens]
MIFLSSSMGSWQHIVLADYGHAASPALDLYQDAIRTTKREIGVTKFQHVHSTISRKTIQHPLHDLPNWYGHGSTVFE